MGPPLFAVTPWITLNLARDRTGFCGCRRILRRCPQMMTSLRTTRTSSRRCRQSRLHRRRQRCRTWIWTSQVLTRSHFQLLHSDLAI